MGAVPEGLRRERSRWQRGAELGGVCASAARGDEGGREEGCCRGLQKEDSKTSTRQLLVVQLLVQFFIVVFITLRRIREFGVAKKALEEANRLAGANSAMAADLKRQQEAHAAVVRAKQEAWDRAEAAHEKTLSEEQRRGRKRAIQLEREARQQAEEAQLELERQLQEVAEAKAAMREMQATNADMANMSAEQKEEVGPAREARESEVGEAARRCLRLHAWDVFRERL